MKRKKQKLLVETPQVPLIDRILTPSRQILLGLVLGLGYSILLMIYMIYKGDPNHQ